jgi:mRNA interferase RelE/StbE
MASYRVELARAAAKDLRRIAPQFIPRIAAAVETLADNPRPPGCLKLAGSEDAWRIRVGDYRIIYVVVDSSLLVTVKHIRHRREAYRDI